MKDVPGIQPDGLEIAVICEREDPRDAFVSNRYDRLAAMPAGARLGSSSLRRRLQVKLRNPELEYLDLRGNVDTRLRKLDDGEFDAIILAAAGLRRLRLEDRIREHIDPSICIPSPGQGAVGIECRSGDDHLKALLKAIDHEPTHHCVRCERTVSSALEAHCNLPIAAFAEIDGGQLRLSAFVSDLPGDNYLREVIEGPVADGPGLAEELSGKLIARGAGELVAAAGAHSS